MFQKIFIWDNDGTIMGSVDPNDASQSAKKILPNVEKTMHEPNSLNIICSGCKTPESELQNFDPEQIAQKMKTLMNTLPISIATFSPAIGGVECYAITKSKSGDFETRKAHEDDRYKSLVGHFKKPGNGMLVVIRDIVREMFDHTMDPAYTFMVGDTWHDEEAASSFGISFVEAQKIHKNTNVT